MEMRFKAVVEHLAWTESVFMNVVIHADIL